MHRRCAALIVLLLAAGEAHAHRLEAQAFVRPFGMVRIESWYETGDAPKGAKVEVFDAADAVLATGHLDGDGVWAFPYAGAGPLRIVVNAGAGHVATVRLKPEELARGAAESRALGTWLACLTPTPSPWLTAALMVDTAATPLSEPAPPLPPRATGPQWRNLALGLGVLAAVMFLALALRKRRTPA